jgi:uncharacterized protein (DUF488 family)
MNSRRTILTVGHSSHEFPTFVQLLKRHGVTAIADVRSHPRSRFAHFSRSTLEAGLKTEGVEYVFLGKELGARRDEAECYVDDRADYRRIALLPTFVAGMERIERGSQSHVIALMCAEKDPLDCHRTVLVARQLSRRGASIGHILADGELESQSHAEQRLVRMMGVEPTLFEPDRNNDALIERAYDERGLQIAYRRTPN